MDIFSLGQAHLVFQQFLAVPGLLRCLEVLEVLEHQYQEVLEVPAVLSILWDLSPLAGPCPLSVPEAPGRQHYRDPQQTIISKSRL